MKNVMTFGTIVAVHVVAFVMIAVQPACTSNKGIEKPKNTNQAVSNTEIIIPEQKLQEGSAQLRVAPSRPARTIDNKKNTGDVLVNEENQSPASSGLLQPTELDAKVDVSVALEQSAMPEIYVVKAGDNLTKLAKQNNTTVASIKDLNNLKDNNIFVGQKLKIPAPMQKINAPAPKANEQTINTVEAEGDVYIVKTGDSLSIIAQRNKTTVAAIKDLNGLSKDTIFIGQKLKMPKASAVAKPVAPKQVVAKDGEYIVQRGDILSSIALKHKMSLAKIQKLNPNIDPNKLQVGQIVIVGDKSTPAPVVVAPAAPAVKPAPAVAPAPVVKPAPSVAPVAPVVSPAPAAPAAPVIINDTELSKPAPAPAPVPAPAKSQKVEMITI